MEHSPILMCDVVRRDGLVCASARGSTYVDKH